MSFIFAADFGREIRILALTMPSSKSKVSKAARTYSENAKLIETVNASTNKLLKFFVEYFDDELLFIQL